MNFQSLLRVEDFQVYLDRSFKSGNKAALSARSKFKGVPVEKSRFVELERIKAINDSLDNDFLNILKSFPDINNLPAFYLELLKCVIDYNQIKKSLGAVGWARNKVYELYRVYYHKVKSSRNIADINLHRRSFYGRVCSAVKQIRHELDFLEESRRTMKGFPAIKTDIFTVVIAGFPNVGKSTLLKSITGASPKVASYPFTTQRMMLGYLAVDGKKVQFVDTPGLLDRSLVERNRIELQAILALRHLAGLVLFVIDPTQGSGYDVNEQLSLLRQVKKMFSVPLVVAISKVDAADAELVSEVKGKLKGVEVFEISAEKKQGVDKVIEFISSSLEAAQKA